MKQKTNDIRYWEGFLDGAATALGKKKRKIISETEAARMSPGVSTAQEFREAFVFRNLINPILPPHTTRFYYYLDEVEEMIENMQHRFKPVAYAAAKRKYGSTIFRQYQK